MRLDSQDLIFDSFVFIFNNMVEATKMRSQKSTVAALKIESDFLSLSFN